MSSSTSSPVAPRPTPTTASPLGFPAEWPLVWLRARSKAAVGTGTFTAVRSHALAKRYLERGANLGLLTGSRSGIAVVDNDRPDLFAEMEVALGALTLFVRSGRGGGRGHYYVRWSPGLPKVITWKGEKVGELLGEGQYAVMPPSIHPDTGRRYAWDTDPLLTPIPPLPAAWQAYLATQRQTDRPQKPPEAQTLPRDEVVRREALALAQPGASRRTTNGRIKFQCPRCADSHQDNAVLFTSGAVGCSQDDAARTHRAALRALFGITAGTRIRPDDWTRSQIERLITDRTRTPFTGKHGITDTAILLAHAQIALRLGSWEYGASERTIAEAAGVQRSTVQASHERLIHDGRLIRTAAGTLGGTAARWRLVPRSYQLQGPGQVSSAVQSLPSKGELRKEETGPRRKPLDDLSLILAHDCFRNVIGLGKGCGLVYVRLLQAGAAGINLLVFGRRKKATTWKQLDRLRAFNLARRDRRTHRWVLGPASLDRVVKRLRADGRRLRQQAQHAIDRDMWFNGDRVVRFPPQPAIRRRS